MGVLLLVAAGGRAEEAPSSDREKRLAIYRKLRTTSSRTVVLPTQDLLRIDSTPAGNATPHPDTEAPYELRYREAGIVVPGSITEIDVPDRNIESSPMPAPDAVSIAVREQAAQSPDVESMSVRTVAHSASTIPPNQRSSISVAAREPASVGGDARPLEMRVDMASQASIPMRTPLHVNSSTEATTSHTPAPLAPAFSPRGLPDSAAHVKPLAISPVDSRKAPPMAAVTELAIAQSDLAATSSTSIARLQLGPLEVASVASAEQRIDTASPASDELVSVAAATRLDAAMRATPVDSVTTEAVRDATIDVGVAPHLHAGDSDLAIDTGRDLTPSESESPDLYIERRALEPLVQPREEVMVTSDLPSAPDPTQQPVSISDAAIEPDLPAVGQDAVSLDVTGRRESLPSRAPVAIVRKEPEHRIGSGAYELTPSTAAASNPEADPLDDLVTLRSVAPVDRDHVEVTGLNAGAAAHGIVAAEPLPVREHNLEASVAAHGAFVKEATDTRLESSVKTSPVNVLGDVDLHDASIQVAVTSQVHAGDSDLTIDTERRLPVTASGSSDLQVESSVERAMDLAPNARMLKPVYTGSVDVVRTADSSQLTVASDVASIAYTPEVRQDLAIENQAAELSAPVRDDVVLSGNVSAAPQPAKAPVSLSGEISVPVVDPVGHDSVNLALNRTAASVPDRAPVSLTQSEASPGVGPGAFDLSRTVKLPGDTGLHLRALDLAPPVLEKSAVEPKALGASVTAQSSSTPVVEELDVTGSDPRALAHDAILSQTKAVRPEFSKPSTDLKVRESALATRVESISTSPERQVVDVAMVRRSDAPQIGSEGLQLSTDAGGYEDPTDYDALITAGILRESEREGHASNVDSVLEQLAWIVRSKKSEDDAAAAFRAMLKHAEGTSMPEQAAWLSQWSVQTGTESFVADIRYRCAQSLYDAELYDDALAALDAYVESHNQGLDRVAMLQGLCLFRANRNPEGRAVFQRLIEKYPDSLLLPRAHFLMAWTYIFTEENEHARASLEKIVTDYPDSRYVSRAQQLLESLQ